MHHVHLGTRHFILYENLPSDEPPIKARYHNNIITAVYHNGSDTIWFRLPCLEGVIPLPRRVEDYVDALYKQLSQLPSGENIDKSRLEIEAKEIEKIRKRLREIPDCTRN